MMKRLIRNLTLLISACILFVGCPKHSPEDDTPPQTIIVYMAGMHLGGYFNTNRNAIKAALNFNIQGKSRVVMFYQASKTKAELKELYFQDGLCQEKILATYDLPSQMTASEMGYIFKDIIGKTPSKSHSLILGAHGLGWIPIGAEPESSAAYLSKDGKIQMLTHEELWERKGDIVTRYLGEDSNPENRFDVTDLAEALTSTGVKLDYILFDACFMANVESIYDLRNNAKYIVGSPCEIMGAGFPYTNIMPLLLQNNGMSYDLDAVCRQFNEDYAKNPGYSGTVALIDCSQMDGLAQAMKRVNNANKKEYRPNDIQAYEGQSSHIFFDLGDYVDKMCDDAEAKKAFDEQLSRTAISKYTLDTFFSMYGKTGQYKVNIFTGMNTSAPSVLYRSAYEQTAWYKATH